VRTISNSLTQLSFVFKLALTSELDNGIHQQAHTVSYPSHITSECHAWDLR